jgi:hypothetical protein
VASLAFLELGYSVRSARSSNHRITQSPDSFTNIAVTIDSLSFQQTYQTLIHRVHSGYSAKINTLDLSAALDAEQGNISGNVDNKGDRHSYKYFTLLPHLQGNWKLGSRQTISFQYQGTTLTPSLQQATPVTDLTNPRSPATGNPALKASHTHNGSIQYEKSTMKGLSFTNFGVGLSYTAVLDPIAASVEHPRDTSQIVQYTTYINSGPAINLTLDYHYTLPSFFNHRVRITGNGSMSRSQAAITSDGQTYGSRGLNTTHGLHLQYLVPDALEINIRGNYSLTYTSYTTASQLPAVTQSVNLGISGKLYLFSHWSCSYMYNETYFATGGHLESTPASLTAGLQREFLRHNRASMILSGFNLLNSKTEASQSITATTINRSQTAYTGRYLLATLIIRFQNFHQ